jgi:hypothetical protein
MTNTDEQILKVTQPLLAMMMEALPTHVMSDIVDKANLLLEYVNSCDGVATEAQKRAIVSLCTLAMGDLYMSHVLDNDDREVN